MLDFLLKKEHVCITDFSYAMYFLTYILLLKATDLVLRKMINFSDCTVCLDKRNASGKIEFYQEPLLYKCSFRTRLHFTYDNLNSKMPSIIKVGVQNKYFATHLGSFDIFQNML